MRSETVLGIVLLVIGAIATVAEIHSLTIYLIAVAVACFAAAGVAFAGGGLDVALIVLAGVILFGLPVAHWARGRLKNRASDEITADDIGNRVTIVASDGGVLRVAYRGSNWDARLDQAAAATPQIGDNYRIVARDGNVLVLASAPDGRA
ncbi:MAG TPA: NfeD family protein [Gammaproteobacteria bacterium]|nr:NfeD family protein [Gammaproteobacteria bacterium]